MKKLVIASIIGILAFSNAAYAEFYDDYTAATPYYDKGTQFLNNYQYTSAITEFRKALNENPQDISSKIGITNSYISRAAYYNNKSHEYQKAANDLRSALFYMKYYDGTAVDYNMTQAATAAEENLQNIMTNMNADRSPKARSTSARILRANGEFAASAYEYFQLLGNATYQKEASVGIGDVMKIYRLKDRSVEFYEKAVKLDPKNASYHVKLANAYESIGNSDAAASEYNLALQNSNEKSTILDSLEEIWKKKTEQVPNDAEAHANLGVVYQKEGKYDLAMLEYQKAETLNPSNVTTRMNLGTLYQYQKNYDAAIAAYNSIIQIYPNNSNAHLYKAQCLKAMGEHNEEALTEYKLALSYDPNNKSARTEMFDLLKSTMPADQVLSYLYQNMQSQTPDANTCYDFAYELHKANKLDDAITYYKEAIKLNPNLVDAYVNLSQVYKQKNDMTQALATIDNARKLYPANSEIKKQYDSINAEISASQYTEASKLFDQCKYQEAMTAYFKMKPQTAESALGIGACYQALENDRAALEYYKKAYTMDSTNSDIPYYIGAIYLNLEDYTNARIYLNKSIALNKNNEKPKSLLTYAIEQEDNAQLEKALDMYDKGKMADALRTVNTVILRSPKCGAAYYYRGLIYDAQKHYGLAANDYNRAVTYSKDFSLAYYSLGVDYDILGKHAEAKIAFQKYLASKPEENEYTRYARKRIAQAK